MKSVMKHNFSQIPRADIPRSSFDRSHGHKLTLDADKLVPIFLDEVLPGDTFSLSTTAFARLATPLAPYMDNAFLDTFFFFVPSRLLWDNWQRFNGEQDNPGDSTDYTIPSYTYFAGILSSTGTASYDVDGADDGWHDFHHSVSDYFGLPCPTTSATVDNSIEKVNLLPFRAYHLIYREWFRDENLISTVLPAKGDHSEQFATDQDAINHGFVFDPYIRAKCHDYFTSCLPWPQKGPGVEIPITSSFGITSDDGFGRISMDSGSSGIGLGMSLGSYPTPGVSGSMNSGVVSSVSGVLSGGPIQSGSVAVNELAFQNISGVGLDAISATINSLRTAFQLQRLFERDARGGTRYTEILRSHFGVISPDSRLQRPEFLGGGSQRLNVHQVPQTSSTDSTTPQGNLAAFGVISGRAGSFHKSFVEHGYIIGIANIRADLTYSQGLDRMWSRRTRFDFYWPALAHLGEQAVLNKELFCQGLSADDDVFGYQERYAEYRYKPSRLSGLMRPGFGAGSLEQWTLSQYFPTLPSLNKDFIQSNTPFDRIVAVPSEPHFIMDLYFAYRCARPMPTYSVPGLIDHF